MQPKTILVTGAAGFIGFHVSRKLLESGASVVGVDSLTAYYDPRIKNARLEILKKYPKFIFVQISIADYKALEQVFKDNKIDEVVHLAAQAGVRYSLTNPQAYADSNYVGTLNIFEAARNFNLPRVVYASSSSVYGANEKQPFSEADPVDRPISLYAATKRANELLAYTYNHLFGFETVGLRFFTVYGEWGRPDLALFKFVKRMRQNKSIELYNNGDMKRSFTHIDDVVDAIVALLQQAPQKRNLLYNLGGSEAVTLIKFVAVIEEALGSVVQKTLAPLQPGDVPETVADCSLAARDLGYVPKVSIEEGIKRFVTWFIENEQFLLLLDEPAQ